MKSKLVLGGALFFTLFALPVLAVQDPLAQIFSTHGACGEPPALAKASVGAFSTCTAQCWDGSSVQCSGTNCTATDSACSVGERGSCWGNTSGGFNCPPCEEPPPTACYASAYCGNGNSVSCQGTAPNCFEQDYCFAYCDGTYYWCGEPC